MGFDKEYILDTQPLPVEYFCPVCKTLVDPNEALQTQCTHLYCKYCLVNVVETTKSCPYDGTLLTEIEAKPLMESNKSIAEAIGKVTVRCLYMKSGCHWNGPLSACSTHSATCAFGSSLFVCNNCGTQVAHRQLGEHAQLCKNLQYQIQAVAPQTLPAEHWFQQHMLQYSYNQHMTAVTDSNFAAATTAAPQTLSAVQWYQQQKLQYPSMQQYQQPRPYPSSHADNWKFAATGHQNYQTQMQINPRLQFQLPQGQQELHSKAQASLHPQILCQQGIDLTPAHTVYVTQQPPIIIPAQAPSQGLPPSSQVHQPLAADTIGRVGISDGAGSSIHTGVPRSKEHKASDASQHVMHHCPKHSFSGNIHPLMQQPFGIPSGTTSKFYLEKQVQMGMPQKRPESSSHDSPPLRSPKRQKIMPSSPEEGRSYDIAEMIKSLNQLYNSCIACIEDCEKNHEHDIVRIREVYDEFLLYFSLSARHWIDYANHERCFSDRDKVKEVFERAVAAVPNSLDVWYCYCHFAISAYKGQSIIRRLFERALRFVGKQSRSCKLWDLYLEFEESLSAWYEMAGIYKRILQSSIDTSDWYLTCFKRFAAVHPLHEILTPDEACEMKKLTLFYQKISGASSKGDELKLYYEILEDLAEFKDDDPSIHKEENLAELLDSFHSVRRPLNIFKSGVTLPLPEFFRLHLHVEEMDFCVDNTRRSTVATPIGRRLLKGIIRGATEEYTDGFCWDGLLQPEDILVHFDGSPESEVYVSFLKHATVLISSTGVLSDSSSFQRMLLQPFTLKDSSVPYITSLFSWYNSVPLNVADSAESRNSWIELVLLSPLLSSLPNRLRFYRHLHRLYKNASERVKNEIDSAINGNFIPARVSDSIKRDELLFEVFWFQVVKDHRANNIPVPPKVASEMHELVICYKASQIVNLIRNFESHALDHLKKLGIDVDNFEEIERSIDIHFGFLLCLLVRTLHKICHSNPKIMNILRSFSSGN